MAYPVAPAPYGAAGDPTAVFGRRVVAAGIDLAIAFAPAAAMQAADITVKTIDEYEADWAPYNGGIPFDEYCSQYKAQLPDAICEQADDVLIVGPEPSGAPTLLFIGALLILGVLLQGLTGWTLGKLAMGLRTVREDGRPCGLPRAGLRWVLWLVDGQPCGIPLVGFITGLTTQGHRRVGDMAAKTFVVRKDAAGAPIVVPGMTAPPPPGTYQPPGGAWVPPTAPPTTWAPPAAPPAGASGGWSPPAPDADPSTPGWAAPAPSTDPSTPAPPSTDPAAQGWVASPPSGDEPPPSGWTAPPSPQWGARPPVAPTNPPGVDAPHWDEARNAYIQWDPDVQAWMQWDEPGRRWFKIGGQ